jgi:chorismate mutase/prephenate dehydratase
MSSNPLDNIRVDINNLDDDLLRLLAKRRELVREVARIKTEHGIPLRDKSRENELLSHLIRLGQEKELDSHFILDIFHRIIDDSLLVQQSFLQNIVTTDDHADIRISHLGDEGAYSYLAAEKHFATANKSIHHVGCDDFSEVIQRVIENDADVAMLPIENTTSGGINEVYDLLIDCPLSIVGEELLKIEHCLIAKPGVSLAQIDTVLAHPQAKTQCHKTLKKLGITQAEFVNSTAHALQLVQGDERTNIAAIAGHETAALYNLKVLAKDLADQAGNFSRFVVLAAHPQPVHQSLPCKTTLMLATKQKAGALVDALTVFQTYGINLTKLESRPIIGNPWEEMFYIDLDGNIADQPVAEAIDQLTQMCRFVKVLGSYPSADRETTQVDV